MDVIGFGQCSFDAQLKTSLWFSGQSINGFNVLSKESSRESKKNRQPRQ